MVVARAGGEWREAEFFNGYNFSFWKMRKVLQIVVMCTQQSEGT